MNIAPSPSLKDVTALLEKVGLPTADLTPELLTHFLGAFEGTHLVGVVGLEKLSKTGLLRSLAVDPDSRRDGLGATLVSALEAHAAAQGMTTLYLLTTDADGYFNRHGFIRIAREEAPEAVQQTRQFTSLCPGSATVMRKDIS